jgi:predicted nucleic-acid-binding protein
MIALDTNVVVRLLVDDDPEQTGRARRLIEKRPVLVVPTVLLETEWVLRGAYNIGRASIARSLRGLLGLPQVSVGSTEAVAQALEWFERGLDFADALHVALAADAEAFATFDARLAKRARRITARAVSVP